MKSTLSDYIIDFLYMYGWAILTLSILIIFIILAFHFDKLLYIKSIKFNECHNETVEKDFIQRSYDLGKIHQSLTIKQHLLDEIENNSCYIINGIKQYNISICDFLWRELNIVESLMNYNENINHFETKQDCTEKEVYKVGLSGAWKLCWHENISREDFIICVNLRTRDFGRDWLEEDCECINCVGVGNEMVYNEEGKLINKEVGPLCCDKYNKACIKDSKCTKYNCGEYTVDLL